jgi:membrane protease YdiL (CAAX protease family)
MHLNPYGLISFFVIGVILNYVYYLTDNLLLNIIFHSLLNVMFYLFERSEIAFSHSTILMCVCFYIICGVTLYQSLKYLKIQK